MDYDNLKAEDFINVRERHTPPKKREPKVDPIVSKIVGRKIFATNPKLINLVVKWKNQGCKPADSLKPDNYLKDPDKVKELKKVLG